MAHGTGWRPTVLGLLGCLDVVTPTRVEGWALRLGENAAPPPVLEVLIDGDLVGTVTPDQKRADIAMQWMATPAARLCGFGFDLPKPGRSARGQADQRARGGHADGLTGSPAVDRPDAGR